MSTTIASAAPVITHPPQWVIQSMTDPRTTTAPITVYGPEHFARSVATLASARDITPVHVDIAA